MKILDTIYNIAFLYENRKDINYNLRQGASFKESPHTNSTALFYSREDYRKGVIKFVANYGNLEASIIKKGKLFEVKIIEPNYNKVETSFTNYMLKF